MYLLIVTKSTRVNYLCAFFYNKLRRQKLAGIQRVQRSRIARRSTLPNRKNGRVRANVALIFRFLVSLASTIGLLKATKRRKANAFSGFPESLHRQILAANLAPSLPQFARMDATKSIWLRFALFLLHWQLL